MSQSPTSSTWTIWKGRIKAIILILIVFFAVAPIILAAIPGIENTETYSIYNEDWDGMSIVANDILTVLEGNAPKYEVTNLISNLNVLNRFNGSGVLIINGPAADFAFTETISLILYLLRGGSVVIADDFGTGNDVLDPIFDAFENLKEWSENAEALGFDLPSFGDILGNNSEAGGNDPDPANQIFNGNTGTSGASNEIATDLSQSFMTELIGDLILRFAFNKSGVLMDLGSNDGNPNRPVITDIDDTDIPEYTFTQGIERVQMEMGTIISVKLRVSERDKFGNLLDEEGNIVTNASQAAKKEVWQPLQKLSAALLTGEDTGDGGFELSLPLFPFYSTELSWIESNMDEAADGTAVPNDGTFEEREWGSAKFATALSIPLLPGMGKLIFLADASLFINRWTQDTVNNDNLLLFRNIVEMATFGQDPSPETGKIPVIFDFGHVFHGVLSPALYSTALMKLIAELSMFPLFAPFIPLVAYGYGRRLMPEHRRLRPILLTKRRGETGHSDFEKKLEEIKASGGYGEPIMHLSRRLVRLVQSDVRFEGTFAKNTNEMSKFFADNFSGVGSRRELRSQLKAVFTIAENPTRRLTSIAAKKYLGLLKKLIDLLE